MTTSELADVFTIHQTNVYWRCVPAVGRVWRALVLGWLFCLAFALPLPIALVHLLADLAPAELTATMVLACWVMAGMLAFLNLRFWRQRHLPLLADLDTGALTFGGVPICPLADISAIALDSALSGENARFGLLVRTRDGRRITLPLWFQKLPATAANDARESLERFLRPHAAAMAQT